MAFVAHSLTVPDIIRRAAALQRDTAVLQQQDAPRILDYYDALNEFLQSFARSRPWWWLMREAGLATRANVAAYRLRLQSRASVELAAAFASGESVTISGREYGYETGDVELSLTGSETVAQAAAALVAGINGDEDAECLAAVDEHNTALVYLYWLGEDGNGETVTATVSATTSDFALHLQDFSRVHALNWQDNWPLQRLDPEVGFRHLVRPLASQPRYYCLDGGLDQLRVLSDAGGAPDAAYYLRMRYQARPSAVLPDGRGDLDFPEEFHDLLPHAIVLLMKAGIYDEAAIWGDEWMQRRLAELESYQIDLGPEPDYRPPSTDLVFRLDTRVEE